MNIAIIDADLIYRAKLTIEALADYDTRTITTFMLEENNNDK